MHMQLRCIWLGAVPFALLCLGGAGRAGAQADAGLATAAPHSQEPPTDAGAAADAAADGGGAPDAAPPQMVPPQLLHSPPPVFPREKLSSGEHPTVVLKVTVFADGSLGDVVVEHSAGAAFDQAAQLAVRNWTFAPARRGDAPIASRVGVAVHFELPELGVHEVTALTAAEEPVPHVHKEPPAPARSGGEQSADADVAARAQVAGQLRNEQRAVSDYQLSGEQLRATPHRDAADLMQRAPGLVVARIEGDAVAPRLMLRGFDADHGQDIELSVDGVPVNQPSHIHGQGYADLSFVIPETVRQLRVTEGVYDPRQGDFAVAGSADFELGVEQRGLLFSSGYGSFHTFRELALYAPRGFSADTFGAAMLRKSDGFGQNRASLSGGGVAQLGLDAGRVHFTLHGSLFAARADMANVLRRDDIDARRVGFYDVYPLPTAEAQGANSQRAQLSARARWHGQRGENAELTLFFVQNEFRVQANYTGFTQVSQTNPDWAGRGDLIEQLNQDRMLGFKGRYRTAELRPFSWSKVFVEVGSSGRFNAISQQQNLLEAPDNTTWDRRIDADIAGVDVGGYLDLDLSFVDRVHLRGGLRTDLINYKVSDALANYLPAFRAENHIPGYRRSATGIALGPRVSLQVDAARGLSLIAAYGEGYRSAMALLLDDGEPAPFTKVRSADVGFKYALSPRGADASADDAIPALFNARASVFTTHLSDDVAFEPEEGRATPVGPSRRDGFTVYADASPFSWAFVSLSATYVHAVLLNPPYASADDPDPSFEKGQLLPYVPPVVLRADLALSHALTSIAEHPLTGRVGAGYTYWSSRPLPYGDEASAVSLVDAELSLGYRAFRLSFSCFNLFDHEYAAMELSYPSSWNPDSFASRVPARHVMAGAPRTFFGTLEIRL
ncbi:MAG TPA: TonB-dependent receptor [Polyangiales bacterium]